MSRKFHAKLSLQRRTKIFYKLGVHTGKGINQPSKAKCASGSLLFKGVNFPWKHVTKEQGAALIIAQQFSMKFFNSEI